MKLLNISKNKLLFFSAVTVGSFIAIFLYYTQPETARFTDINEFKIGFILPYDTRDEYSNGIELALDEINKSGGILGKTVTVIKYTEPPNLKESLRENLNSVLQASHKLAYDKSVIGVVSVARSMSAVAAAPILEQKAKILITASATDPVINKMQFDNLFSTQFSDEDTAAAIVHHAAENKRHKFVVIADDSLSAANLISRFSSELAYAGGEILFKESGHHNRERFERSVLFLLNNPMFNLEDIDAILIVARSPIEYMYAVSRLRELNIYQPIYAPRNIISAASLDEFRENNIDEIYVVTPYDRYFKAPETERFLSVFTQKFSKPPSLADEEAYTGLKILAFGVNNAKSTNSSVVANFLKSMRYIKTFTSPSGNLAFDPTGRITDSDIFILKFTGDKFVSVARYMKPFSWKTSKYDTSADIHINLQ